MSRQYLGIISEKNSQVPLRLYPTLWMVEDDLGGFCRFKTKIDINGLKFTCRLIPARDDEVETALSALVEECSSYGKNNILNLKPIHALFLLGVQVNPKVVIPKPFSRAVEEMMALDLLKFQ
jgi:hypothetical protein